VPIYEYQCEDCGDVVEAFQKMSDEPLTVCERCGGPLRKVLHPVAIHFKGSGFYTTDYGKGRGRHTGGREPGASDPTSSDVPSSGSTSDDGSSSGSGAKAGSGEGKAREKQKAT
jgi:putative FmdB family regulatory protein